MTKLPLTIELKKAAFYRAPAHAGVRPYHLPPRIELIEVVTGGNVYFGPEKQPAEYGRGTIFWHRAGEHTIWNTTPEAPYRCAVFRFHVDREQTVTPRVSQWDMENDLDRFVLESMRLFHRRELAVEHLSLYIYGTLLRHALTRQPDVPSDDYPAGFEPLLAYIRGHPDKDLSMRALARYSGISASHLHKLFQRRFHTTPQRYILSERLTVARSLLLQNDTPIKQIAAVTGFHHLEVFYRCFRREYGTAPAEYRRVNHPYNFDNT
jgi:AraC-like DNA-binding protein